MLVDYKLGQGSIVLRVKVRDSSVTTGAGLTGLTSVSTGLIISTIADNEATATVYTVAASHVQTITTLGTYAAPSASNCRFKEVDATNHPGIYEIQIADARFAVSSAKSVLISLLGATNMVQTDALVPLRSVDPYSATAFITGVNSLAPPANWNTDVVQSGDAYSRLGAAGAGLTALGDTRLAHLDADVSSRGTSTFAGGAVASVTGNVGGSVASVTAGVTVTTNNDKTGYTASTVSDKTGYSLSSGGVQAIWDALTSALTTAGSIGKRLVDFVTTLVYATPPAALTDYQQRGVAVTLPSTWSLIGTPVTADISHDIASRLAASAYTAPDNADVVTALADLVTLLGRTDPTTALTAIKAVTDHLATMINGTPAFTATALALAPTGSGSAPSAAAVAAEVDTVLSDTHGSGAWGAASSAVLYGESGAFAVTIDTFDTDGVSGLEGCAVWVSRDSAGVNRSQTKLSDASGRVTFTLDGGTVYIWRSRPGRTFANPETGTVG